MVEIFTKKYNGLTYLGWFACGAILVIRILLMWVLYRLNLGNIVLVYDVIYKIQGGFNVLLMISYFNYIRPLPKAKAGMIGFLLAGSIIFRTVNIFVGISWGAAGFLKVPVMNIPVLILFLIYFKHRILPKIIAALQALRMTLQIIGGILIISSQLEIYYSVNSISSYTFMLTLVLIIGWFVLGIPDFQNESSSAEPKMVSTANRSPTSQGNRSTGTSSSSTRGSKTGIYPSTSGWTHGIPRLAYWCDQCAKKVNFRPKTNKEIVQANPCPKCGTTLKAWWVEPTRASYFKFAGGGIILFGAMTTILFETNFGNIGLYPMIMIGVLTIIETLIGAITMYSGMKLKINGPAPYATTTPSLEPQSQFLKEMLLLIVPMLIGCFALYGINVGIVSIFF